MLLSFAGIAKAPAQRAEPMNRRRPVRSDSRSGDAWLREAGRRPEAAGSEKLGYGPAPAESKAGGRPAAAKGRLPGIPLREASPAVAQTVEGAGDADLRSRWRPGCLAPEQSVEPRWRRRRKRVSQSLPVDHKTCKTGHSDRGRLRTCHNRIPSNTPQLTTGLNRLAEAGLIIPKVTTSINGNQQPSGD